MGSVLIAMPKSEDAYHIARSLSERGQLLDPAEAAADARGHDDQDGFLLHFPYSFGFISYKL